MFKSIKAASASIQGLTDGVAGLCKLLETHLERTAASGSLADRLDALELSRATWEAEVEAELTRADTRFKSARNAEERARALGKKHETDADLFGDQGEAEPPAVPGGNVEISEAQGMQPLHLGMEEVSPKTHRLRYKFS